MKFFLKIYALRHKKIKLLYYIQNYIRFFIPLFFYRWCFSTKRFDYLIRNEGDYVLQRVNYYNKISRSCKIGPKVVRLKDFKPGRKHKTYFFDTFIYTRFFSPELKINYKFGDITAIPDEPAIVKSRPVNGENANSVLLKLNKLRHYTFVQDNKRHFEKKNALVWRGHVSKLKTTRIRFLENFFDHPLCNVGQINDWNGNKKWKKPKMSIDEQLTYKFILCLEGVDVASNLKWVMSSNSIAVMPEPKFETWFMEGKLIPDFHYIRVNDDFSDLLHKIEYFARNPEQAAYIVQNAHEHVKQFKNRRREDLIALRVLQKFFEKAGQKGSSNFELKIPR